MFISGWKHFQDRATKGILVGYEGEYIYRMLIPNGQIMRYSNVDWTKNFPAQNMPNLETAKYHHTTQDNRLSGLFDSFKELKIQPQELSLFLWTLAAHSSTTFLYLLDLLLLVHTILNSVFTTSA